MKARKILSIAWDNLRQRKLRTSLTTLSVVIGITAIIGLASLGEGFRIDLRTRLQSGFELDNLTIIPGSLFAGYSRQGFTDNDVGNISQVAGVKFATGIMQLGNATVYNDGKAPAQAFVAAAVNFSEFVKVFGDRFAFENGTLPDPDSNESIVIGYKVNRPTENDTAPWAVPGDKLNMTLQLGFFTFRNYTFTVSGTLLQAGTPGITNFDYWVFIPLQTARDIYNKSGSDDLIFVKVFNAEDSETVAKNIEALFPPFRITILVPLTFLKQVDNILFIVQLFLLAVASISLIVAGIGIMNIMMVSVMERTREIGILKAIGARSRTVLGMFLGEAVLIGLIGAVIGVLTGYGLSYLLAFLLTYLIPQQQGTIIQTPEAPQRLTIVPVFTPEWTIAAFVFGVVVCMVFGLYPARKASKLNPVDALRYE